MLAKNASLKILASVLLAFSLSSCDIGSAPGNNNLAPLHSPDIDLAEISNTKCLDLEKYLNLLNTSLGEQPIRQLTTDFNLKPVKQNHISRNFELRLAFGKFVFNDSAISQIMELAPVAQVGCDKIIQPAGNSAQESKIIRAGKDFITMRSQWNQDSTYQWVSPNHLKVISSFVNGDYLCSEDSSAQVTTTKDYFWNAELNADETIPVSTIKDSYLDLLSEATGYPKQNLFSKSDSLVELPMTKIYSQRLNEMSAQPIRPELLLCE